jgi:hypothetical protein
MKQRQPRLGDVLDDYCPRERRLTNHAVVAMVGSEVKQTRCATCDAEHDYKHARLPRQRRKSEPAALYSQVLASAAPKKVAHEPPEPAAPQILEPAEPSVEQGAVSIGTSPGEAPGASLANSMPGTTEPGDTGAAADSALEDGPVHRPLIRAQLPRQERQQAPLRPAPDFTIRQPGGRPARFRPRPQHSGPLSGGYPKSNAAGGAMRGAPRPLGGRPPTPHLAKRHGPGRKRSK